MLAVQCTPQDGTIEIGIAQMFNQDYLHGGEPDKWVPTNRTLRSAVRLPGVTRKRPFSDRLMYSPCVSAACLYGCNSPASSVSDTHISALRRDV